MEICPICEGDNLYPETILDEDTRQLVIEWYCLDCGYIEGDDWDWWSGEIEDEDFSSMEVYDE